MRKAVVGAASSGMEKKCAIRPCPVCKLLQTPPHEPFQRTTGDTNDWGHAPFSEMIKRDIIGNHSEPNLGLEVQGNGKPGYEDK
jgi:hypothetical protein